MILTTQNSTQNLFFHSEKKWDFSDVLKEVQTFISNNYSSLVVEGLNKINSENDEVKEQVKRYIKKFLLD